MSLQKLDAKDIKNYLNKEKYAILTLKQLQKDLESVGEDFELSEEELQNNRFEHIEKRLKELLSHLVMHQPEKLMSLLYRIDIPEREVRTKLESDDEQGGITDRLVHLILKRELKKVLFRTMFSN